MTISISKRQKMILNRMAGGLPMRPVRRSFGGDQGEGHDRSWRGSCDISQHGRAQLLGGGFYAKQLRSLDP